MNQYQLPKTKLKDLRDYERNCKELERDLQWMARWFPVLWVIVCAAAIILIWLTIYFGSKLNF